MTADELLHAFTPLTLTTAARDIARELAANDPFLLTDRLGRNVITVPSNDIVFEIEESSYNLAPLGRFGDQSTDVHGARKKTTHNVVPPQIYLRDTLSVVELEKIRFAGQNPINMSAADRTANYNYIIGMKQQGLSRLIDRRIEWMIAQVLQGKLTYTSEKNTTFSFDYNLDKSATFKGGEFWNADNPGDPIAQLRDMATTFRALNHQIAPDFIVMGADAARAFINHPEVKQWMQSQGQQIYQSRIMLARGNAQPIGNLYGAELYEYTATYQDDKGQPQPYIDNKCVFMTNSKLWALYYGAIYDLDAGSTPVVVGTRFSKLAKDSEGKTLNIYVESHPLPVVFSTTAVVKSRVVN